MIAALVLVSLPPSPADADGHEGAQQRREEVRQQRADAAAELDVLQATQAEVEAALDALEANVAAEQDLLAEANRRVEEAVEEVAQARAEERRMEEEVVRLRGRLRDLAVDAFVAGPGKLNDTAVLLDARDLGEAVKVSYLAGLEVERQDDLAGQLEQQGVELQLQRQAAEGAERRARDEREQAAVRVAEVERARDEQARFVSEVEAEFERRLAEAAALEQLDQQLAAEIVRGEQALADRLAAEAARAAEVAATSRRAAPASARGRAASPRRTSTSGDMVSVGGIIVHAGVADGLAGLLGAAQADGVQLGGGGYRDPADQQRLREANCPDPVSSPASSCSPPTARTGRSMHEEGRAIDFTYEGRGISSRSNPAFRWLDANASRFGFRNLPSEPWHWSTNGR